jgi:hypothetical protein
LSFLYPRTITFTRPGAQPTDQVGFQSAAPSGDPAAETPIPGAPDNIPANIELRGRQGTNPVGLPSDSQQDEWNITIPKRALAKGVLMDGDIGTDDEGARYQIRVYWNSLGYALRGIKLKA